MVYNNHLLSLDGDTVYIINETSSNPYNLRNKETKTIYNLYIVNENLKILDKSSPIRRTEYELESYKNYIFKNFKEIEYYYNPRTFVNEFFINGLYERCTVQ